MHAQSFFNPTIIKSASFQDRVLKTVNCLLDYSTYSILIIEGMSSARGKAGRNNLSSADLLHSGVRRTVTREDYTKLFTKIRIGQPKRNSFLPSSGGDAQQDLQAGNIRLRQAIKELEASNIQLAAAISKEHKLELLLDKRIEVEDLAELTLGKAIEIKLMLEADALQEQLREREGDLEKIVRDYREREVKSRSFQDTRPTELYAILCDDESEVGQLLEEKGRVIQTQQEKITLMREKAFRAREIRKARAEKLKEMDRLVSKAKENLPNVNKISDENQSGIYGTQVRAKTTESLQLQIERLHDQRIGFQSKIQSLVEQKIRQKIEILKAINQLQNLVITPPR